MATEKELKLAKSTYDTMRAVFDENNWKYDQDDENLILGIGMKGDDLPMYFHVICSADKQLVSIISTLPFQIQDDKRVEAAVAISTINYTLIDGNFDYDFTDGTITFRVTASFKDSLIGKALLDYMFELSIAMVDKYNDLLQQLDQGNLSIQDFVQKVR